MSDFPARKRPPVLSSSSSVSVEPDAPSKKLDSTLEKLSAARENNKGEHSPTKEGQEYSIRSNSGLKTLRVTSATDEGNKPKAAPDLSNIRAKRLDEMFEGDADNEPVLMLSPKNAMPVTRSKKYKFTNILGFLMSAGWLGLSAFYVQNNMGFAELFSQQPHILGGFMAGILAPLALLWMILAYIQRGSDIQMYADALRGELQAMIFPSEERSQVIHKDIEALCAQAAELSTSSKAILNSIHRARVGLRNEIRDFSGLSKKTEFHIDRLADSLAERSAKLLQLTDEIETRTTSLDAKTISGAKAWDEAATSILSRASDIEKAMRDGAKDILSAAEEADTTSGSINQKLASSFEVLKTSVDSVKGMTDGTVQAIMDASKTIEDNRDTLSEGAKQLSEKAAEITDSLNGTVSAIQDSVDQMVTKTDSLEDRLSSRVTSLNGIIAGMDGKIGAIESMGAETANKLSEAMLSAVSGADNIGVAVRRAIESLSSATAEAKSQAEGLVSQTTEKISALQNTGASTAKNIENVLSLVDSSREKMQSASSMVEVQVEKLSAAVGTQAKEIAQAQETLNERIESIQLHMNEPLEAMTRAVDKASEKHAQIEETLSKRIAELNLASDKALDNAGTIREGLRAQTQEMSTLVGQIAGHSRSVLSLIKDQKDSLGMNVGEALHKIESVSVALEGQSERLSSISERAEGDIGKIKGNLSEQCDEITLDTNKVMQSLSGLNDIIEAKVKALVTESMKANEAVQGVSDQIAKTAEDVAPIYSKSIKEISDTQQKFEGMAESFEAGTSSNLDKLKSMGIMFDERLQTLTASAEDASRILDKSSENLSGRVDDIESATKAASTRIQDMERLMKNQAADIHLTSDQALLKIENIQKALNEQFQDISVSVGESVAQIEDVGQKFVKQAQTIKDVSGEAIGKFDHAGNNAAEQTEQLNQLARMSGEQIAQMVARVKEESKQLLESSSQTLLELKKTSDGFANRAKEVEAQMRLSLKNTAEYGDALDAQADKVASSSHKTVDRISQAISQLSTKMLDVDKAAHEISGKIEASRDKLSQETEHLADVSVKAARVVEEAAHHYGRQSSSLFKATQDAVQQAEKIRLGDSRIQRESFMGSAKFVLESLHSLSVDLTRALEGEIQEKIWKAYQKGDIGVFTSRLLEMKDSHKNKESFEKMRKKYANDNEFRTYTNRFIRQFEEIYDQAGANDHGDILSTTFASSDVGRLYGFLCDVATRQSLIKKKALRAA